MCRVIPDMIQTTKRLPHPPQYVHEADLGNGREFEHYLHRESYFPVLGTCWESLAGGNHFRAWKQNGTLANSGAWFLG